MAKVNETKDKEQVLDETLKEIQKIFGIPTLSGMTTVRFIVRLRN